MTSESIDTAPEAQAEPGWRPTARPARWWNECTFLEDEPPNRRVRLAYFTREADGALMAKAWFGARAGGPPQHAHGGSIAAVLDEVMGMAVWAAGHRAVAAKLSTRFRAMVPVGTDAVVETSVGEARGRKLRVTARLYLGDVEYADGEALFVVLSSGQLASLLDKLQHNAEETNA